MMCKNSLVNDDFDVFRFFFVVVVVVHNRCHGGLDEEVVDSFRERRFVVDVVAGG